MAFEAYRANSCTFRGKVSLENFNDTVEVMATDTARTTHDVEAEAVMGLFPSRPRVLALGEPVHGESVLLDVRNGLFRHLVERHGYRTIALESDCLAGLLVDAYVNGDPEPGAETLDAVMEHGFSHTWFNRSEANRALVRWARAYNADRPEPERLRVTGFDGPLEMTGAESPRRALTALHGHLAAGVGADQLPRTAEALDRLLGPDARWTDPEAIRDPSRSVGRSADARELRLIADESTALLDARRTRSERARLYARTAVGLLRYHHWTADTSPARLTRLLESRAQMMAENLLALAERGPVLVSANNGHLQRHRGAMRMGDQEAAWWPAGALVEARLPRSREGDGRYGVLATALGTLAHHGVGEPPPDTVEGALSALPHDRLLADAPRLAAALGESACAPVARVSPYYGYGPLDPAHLAELDGVVFVRDAGQAG